VGDTHCIMNFPPIPFITPSSAALQDKLSAPRFLRTDGQFIYIVLGRLLFELAIGNRLNFPGKKVLLYIHDQEHQRIFDRGTNSESGTMSGAGLHPMLKLTENRHYYATAVSRMANSSDR